jgi:hypothetical protein
MKILAITNRISPLNLCQAIDKTSVTKYIEQVKQKEEKAKQEEVRKSSQHYVIDHLYYSIPVSDVPIRREQVILQEVPSEIHSYGTLQPYTSGQE